MDLLERRVTRKSLLVDSLNRLGTRLVDSPLNKRSISANRDRIDELTPAKKRNKYIKSVKIEANQEQLKKPIKKLPFRISARRSAPPNIFDLNNSCLKRTNFEKKSPLSLKALKLEKKTVDQKLMEKIDIISEISDDQSNHSGKTIENASETDSNKSLILKFQKTKLDAENRKCSIKLNRLDLDSFNLKKQLKPATTNTRKRFLSTSFDLKEQKDENINYSSDHSSSFYSSDPTKKPKLLSNPKKVSFCTIKSKSEESLNSPETNSTCIQTCPVIGCDSSGHLSGLATKHIAADVCPIYHRMTFKECKEKKTYPNDSMTSICENLLRLKNEKENKILRTKTFNSEETKYLEKIENELTKILVIENESSKPGKSLPGFNPNIYGDLKNLTTSFLINSITNGMTPTAANFSHENHEGSVTAPSSSTESSSLKIHPPLLNDLNVSNFEFELFKESLVLEAKSREIVAEDNTILNPASNLNLINKNNKVIQFGIYEIETWYNSPYPDDYWQLRKLFICQYCLKYMKSDRTLDRHLDKCPWTNPPGREIYRKDKYSFFEIDGKYNKIYCQNLCLLAKLFIDHKTLYYDVEPFLFYILTCFNEKNNSFEMVGYFSKEKKSANNYNLSCILTLPPFMNKGFGRLLIDFSYLLSRVEGKIGSPEKPLSDLGLISYRNYWITTLLNILSKTIDGSEISIKDLSNETGISSNDIISTFQFIGMIKYWKGKHVIIKNRSLINQYVQKRKNSSMDINPSLLKWKPYVVENIHKNYLNTSE